MKYVFSDNIGNLKPSAIREILKQSSKPGLIPFSAGNPCFEAFPVKDIARISSDILLNNPIEALQYSVTEGYEPLRNYMKKYLSENYNVGSCDDDILITSGAQQVMNLSAKILTNRGDSVICEDPSFIGSLNSFRSYGINLVGVKTESDGMNIEDLENALKTTKNVKFIYTIPNFQNPTGVTMSLEKRKKVYELAKKYNVLILEDNPYGELRFRGDYIPSIKSFDDSGIVIYAGSFSKVLSPGIRVGYTVANKDIVSKMVVCKQTDDVHTALWSQMIAFRFISECDFKNHLKKIQAIYKRKAELCMESAKKYLCPKASFNSVDGGLFLWCEIKSGKDISELCTEALQKGVAVVPGTAFLINPTDKTNCIRINYSTPSDEQIVKGLEILGGIL